MLEIELGVGTHVVRFEKSGYTPLEIVGDVSESGFACTSNCGSVVPISGGVQATLVVSQEETMCTWVAKGGGPSAVSFSGLQTLVNMYLGKVTPAWAVKFADLQAGVYYYLRMTAQGNAYSECAF
jgi:hypothetical protein